MRIAVDISPISKSSNSNHKIRGVGRYIKLLADNLQKFDKENDYIFIEDQKKIKDNFDLIHYPYFDPFFITLPFFKSKKTIVTIHDVIPLTHKKEFPVGVKGNLKWQFNKRLVAKVDAILTDSNASKEDIVKVADIDEEKIVAVYLSADEEFRNVVISDNTRSDINLRFGLPKEFILYVGDITWNKNLPRLVKAVESLGIPLVMVGKAITEERYDRNNPWNRDRLDVEKLTANNKLFIKLGYIENKDLVNLYNMAALLCMPSLDEGFGLPVLEAMQSGCPVVTTQMGSLPEIAGDAAFYVDALSVSSIAEGIKKVFESKDMQEDLIKNGLIQSKKFTLKNFVEKTVLSYRSLQA